MYLVLKELHRALGASNDIPVHCIGHSLGSHACGFAGKHLVADPDRDFAKKLVKLFLRYFFKKNFCFFWGEGIR